MHSRHIKILFKENKKWILRFALLHTLLSFDDQTQFTAFFLEVTLSYDK